MNTKQLLSKKIGYSFFIFLGVLCAFLWKAERDLAAYSNILWTGSYLVEIFVFSLIAGALVGGGICFLVYTVAEEKGAGLWNQIKQKSKKIDGKISGKTDLKTNVKADGRTGGRTYWKNRWKTTSERLTALDNKKVFCYSLFLIILCWLPSYLAYYPGICSYDTTIQLAQIVQDSFNDHHPIAHTLLLKGAMALGESVFGNVNTGIGIWVALQMVFLAGAFAYGITILHKLQVKKGWNFLLLLYSMIYPFHWYMSISTIKDTIFSGFFLLQMVSFCVLLLQGERLSVFNQYSVLFVISTVGMILYRNNGRYAMLVLLIFLVLTLWRGKKQRKLWGKLLGYSVVGFLIGNIVVSLLFTLTNAQQGDKREMLSMPIQQLARCMIYHGGVDILEEDDNTIREEDKVFINDFLLNEGYKEYRPDISDPVKRHTNTYVVRYRAKEFVSTYIRLFLKYPGDYVNAALATNAGFLSPSDISHATINVNGRDRGLGYVQTRWVDAELNPQGIYKASLWEGLHEKLESWADNNDYLNIPILKYLFVPGTYLWLYFLLTGVLLVNKRYRMLLPLSLVLGYYATLLLGPTVQLRYIYPVMIVLPFMALLSNTKEYEA